jgi:hypothetical protein
MMQAAQTLKAALVRELLLLLVGVVLVLMV